MGGWDLEQMLRGLEGEFEAALAGDDEAAARDLAFSLAQDVPVVVDALREGAFVVVSGSTVPVDRLGHDYLEAGDWVVPLERAVISLGHTRRPRQIHQVFVGALRAAAREAASVTVGLSSGAEVSGALERANPSHLVVENLSRVAVPLREVAYVRLVRGGSAGVP